VANAKAEPLGIALSKVKQSQEWKLGVLASTTAPWQVELVMNEDREKVAWLIARLESRLLFVLCTFPFQHFYADKSVDGI